MACEVVDVAEIHANHSRLTDIERERNAQLCREDQNRYNVLNRTTKHPNTQNKTITANAGKMMLRRLPRACARLSA